MQAANHPQLGASMEQLALAYSLFTSSTDATKADSPLYYATDSFRSLTAAQKAGMTELTTCVRDALGQAPTDPATSTKTSVSGKHTSYSR